MAEEQVLWDAEFDDRVVTYWLLGGAIVCVVTVIGILLLPVWLYFGRLVCRRYLRTYRCTLTNRTLQVAKGWLVRVEKTVPLDRITDLGLKQGPIMRYFDIEALSVETAGQSSAGALVTLEGIRDGRKFRDAVLDQRDRVVGSAEAGQSRPAGESATDASHLNVQLLADIRDTLNRIEQNLADRP